MNFGAILNEIACNLKSRRVTGCVFLKLDVKDGGIGRVTGYDVAKVPGGGAVFMTDTGSYVLKEIEINS